MNKLILISLIFSLISLEVFAKEECVDGKLRYRHSRKMKTLDASYCYNSNKTTLRSKGKSITVPKVELDSSILDTAVGKPGFNICFEYGGTPQIVEFYADRKWWKLDRCIFKDGSFVDTGTLLSDYFKAQDELLNIDY